MKRLLPILPLLLSAAVGAEKRIIYPPEFRPNMPFSPGVQVGDTLYCAGQTGSDLKTGEYPESFADEVHQTFRRIGIILEAAEIRVFGRGRRQGLSDRHRPVRRDELGLHAVLHVGAASENDRRCRELGWKGPHRDHRDSQEGDGLIQTGGPASAGIG